MRPRLYFALMVPALLGLWFLPSPWSKVAALVVLCLVLHQLTSLALEVYRRRRIVKVCLLGALAGVSWRVFLWASEKLKAEVEGPCT